MARINLNKREHIKVIHFPDGQPHVELHEGFFSGEKVDVVVSIDSPSLMLELLMLSNALDSKFIEKRILYITYLMGARYDRHMKDGGGDSFDLKVFADLINSLSFEEVRILDPHSEVSLELIADSSAISNRFLVEKYNRPNTVIICPDKGAQKKVFQYKEWNPNFTGEVVYCEKQRELSTGKLTLKVVDPEICKNRDCIIIDDICDGGATFLAMAEQIEPAYLTLMVTHGIFSKGYEKLLEEFNSIITSDSYIPSLYTESVTIHPVEL